MNRCERACLAGVVAGAIVLGSAAGARACLFSNTASATANGVLAYRVTALPRTPRGEAVWAPFAFRQTFTPGRVLHLREDMREVSGSMGRAALHWPVRWLFGDGARAAGATTAHAYRHTGLYKAAVQGFYGGGRAPRAWYTFDAIDVVVGAPSREMAWVRATPAPAPVSAATPASGTPTPRPTAGAG